MNSEKQSTNLQMTLRGVNRVGEGQKNVPKLRFKGYEDAWEQRKLGEIVLSEIKGSAKAEMIGGDTPYLETNYLNGGECLFVDSENNVDTDDVIVLWDGSQAGTVYHGFSGALGSTFKAYKTKCLGLFIFQQLKKNQQTIYDKYRTPNIPHVIKTFKDEYDVMLTSEEEQNEIGRYFQQIDHLITLHQRKYDALKSMKKTLLSKIFPKNGEDVPEIRFKGYTDAWEQRKAKRLFVSWVDKGYPDLPVLSATQDKGMVRRDENGINIHYDEKNKSGYKRVMPGQFVIHLRSFQGGFAYSEVEGITSPAYTVFDFKEFDKHIPEFWKYVFSSKDFIRRLEKVTYGIRDGRSIGFEDFLTLKFNVPEKREQKVIAEILAGVNNLITLHQRKLEELKKMKKTLLQQMFV